MEFNLPRDAKDVEIARKRLEEITLDPSLLISGEALQKALDAIVR